MDPVKHENLLTMRDFLLNKYESRIVSGIDPFDELLTMLSSQAESDNESVCSEGSEFSYVSLASDYEERTDERTGYCSDDPDFDINGDVNIISNLIDLQEKLPTYVDTLSKNQNIVFPLHNVKGRPHLLCETLAEDGKVYKCYSLLDTGSSFSLVSQAYLNARSRLTGETFKVNPTMIQLKGHGGHHINIKGETIVSINVRDTFGRLYEIRHLKVLVTDLEDEVTSFKGHLPLIGMAALSCRMARMSMERFLVGGKNMQRFVSGARLSIPWELIENQDNYRELLLGKDQPLRSFDLVGKGGRPLRPGKREVLSLKAEAPGDDELTESLAKAGEFDARCIIEIPGHDQSEFLTTFVNGVAHIEITNKTSNVLLLDELTLGEGREIPRSTSVTAIKGDPVVEAVAAFEALRYKTENSYCLCSDKYTKNNVLVMDMDKYGMSSITGKIPSSVFMKKAQRFMVTNRSNSGYEIFINMSKKVSAKTIKTQLQQLPHQNLCIVLPTKMYSMLEARNMAHFKEIAEAMNFHVEVVLFRRFCQEHRPLVLPSAHQGWIHVRWNSEDAKNSCGILEDDEIDYKYDFDECSLRLANKGDFWKAEFLISSKLLMRENLVQQKVVALLQRLQCTGIEYPITFSMPEKASHFQLQIALPRELARCKFWIYPMENLPMEFVPASVSFRDAKDDIGKYLDHQIDNVSEIDVDDASVLSFEQMASWPDWKLDKISPSEDKNKKAVVKLGAKYEKELSEDPKFQQWIAGLAESIPDEAPGFDAGVEYPDDDMESIDIDKVEIPIPGGKKPDVHWRDTDFQFPEHWPEHEKERYAALFDEYPDVTSESVYIQALNVPEVDFDFREEPSSFHLEYPIKKNIAPFVEEIFRRFLDSGLFKQVIAPPKNVALPSFVILKFSKLKGLSKEEIDKMVMENPDKYLRLLLDCRHISRFLAERYETLPRIDNILLELGEAKYLNCFDAVNFYWSIPISQKSKDYAVISIMGKYYQCQRLPQGLSASVEAATQIMERLRTQVDREKVFSYIDDLICLESDPDMLFETTRKLFQEADKIKLKLSLPKMQLRPEKEAQVLGYVIKWDENREVSHYPTSSQKEVFPSIIDKVNKDMIWKMCGALQWIISFTEPSVPLYCTPLYNLLGKLSKEDRRKEVILTPLEKNSWKLAVHFLKKKANPMHIPRRDAELTLLSDGGTAGFGTVVLAKYELEEVYKMVMMYSRAYTIPQANGSPYAREFVALCQTVMKFQNLIYHTLRTTCITDCLSVVYATLHSIKYTRNLPYSSVPNRYLLALSSFPQVTFKHFPRAFLHLPDVLNKFNLSERILKCEHLHLAHLHELRHGMLHAPIEVNQEFSLDELAGIVEKGIETGFRFVQPFIPEDQGDELEQPACDHPSICGQGPKYPPCFNKCEVLDKKRREKIQQKYCPSMSSKSDYQSEHPSDAEQKVGSLEAASIKDAFRTFDFDTETDLQTLAREKVNKLLDPILQEVKGLEVRNLTAKEIEEAKSVKLDFEEVCDDVIADAISIRDQVPMLLRSPFEKIKLKKILRAQLSHPRYAAIIRILQRVPKENLDQKYKKYVLLGGTLLARRPTPKAKRPTLKAKVIVTRPVNIQLIVICHMLYAHTGQGRLKAILRRAFFVEDLDALARLVCTCCPICLRYKRSPTNFSVMGSIFASEVCETFYCDFATFKRTMVKGRKFKYVLVFTDCRSGLIINFPTANMLSKVVVAKICFVLSCFPVKRIVSDRQSSLVNHPDVQRICRQFNADAIPLRPYAHRGQLSEGSIRLVRRMIRMLQQYTGKSWADGLPELAALILNTTPRQNRGFNTLVTPLDLVFRVQPEKTYDAWRLTGLSRDKIGKAKDYTMRLLKQHLDEWHAAREEHRREAVANSKIQVGTLVLVFRDRERPRDKNRCDFLDPLFKVIRRTPHMVRVRQVDGNREMDKDLKWVVPVGEFPRDIYEDLSESIKEMWKPVLRDDNDTAIPSGTVSGSPGPPTSRGPPPSSLRFHSRRTGSRQDSQSSNQSSGPPSNRGDPPRRQNRQAESEEASAPDDGQREESMARRGSPASERTVDPALDNDTRQDVDIDRQSSNPSVNSNNPNEENVTNPPNEEPAVPENVATPEVESDRNPSPTLSDSPSVQEGENGSDADLSSSSEEDDIDNQSVGNRVEDEVQSRQSSSPGTSDIVTVAPSETRSSSSSPIVVDPRQLDREEEREEDPSEPENRNGRDQIDIERQEAAPPPSLRSEGSGHGRVRQWLNRSIRNIGRALGRPFARRSRSGQETDSRAHDFSSEDLSENNSISRLRPRRRRLDYRNLHRRGFD